MAKKHPSQKRKADKQSKSSAPPSKSKRRSGGMAAVLSIALIVAVIFLGSLNADHSGVPEYGFHIIRKIPHDQEAFTQGFLYHDGVFFESTGQRGASSVRRVDPETGNVLQKVDLDPEYFGEGLAFCKGVLVQLTWTAEKAFVYNHETLERIAVHTYESQGWGLTHDDTHYIMSDGSHRITFRNAAFQTERVIEVREGNRLVKDLNELEYIDGEIWANVWRTWDIVRIDPATGKVLGRINLKGLIKGDATGGEDYLNGIAYDATHKAVYVTGKYYAYIYQIELKRAS